MTAARPVVWIITPSLHREGGTERCVAEQLERWRRHFAVSLYTMDVHGVDLAGVRVRRLWRPPGPHLLRYLWWVAANHVVRWWDRRRLGPPDVLHSPGVNAFDATAIGVHIVFAKHWARVREAMAGGGGAPPTLWRSVHRRLYWWLVRWIERRVYAGPATLWALSREDAAALEAMSGRPPGTVPVVPYGVDAAHFAPPNRIARRDDARQRLAVGVRTVLLLVGNDWYKKGLDCAIRSLAVLPDSYLLAVAGRDDPAPFIRLARALGVGSRLAFWPLTADILTYYAAADCLIAPSREDAFHLPALEALACGLPVVVGAAAGATEILGEAGAAAVLVRDVTQPDQLARAVRDAVEDGLAAAARAARGRAIAERRSWDAYAERTAELVRRERETPRVIVLAVDPWGTGGIERATRTLLLALGERYGPERVGVLAVWGADAGRPLPPCRILYTGTGRAGSGSAARVGLRRGARFAFAALAAVTRWRGPRTLVIACHAHLAPVAWLGRLLSGTPYAVWGHGTEVWGDMRPSVRFSLARAQALFAGTRFTATALARELGCDSSRVAVVPYAASGEVADGTAAPPSADAWPVVLGVARLNREDAYKGADTLLLAWPRVLARRPDAHLVLVGDGDDRHRLERMARHLGLEDRVRFAGRLSDAALAAAYRSATVFALPGRLRLSPAPEGEGFGLVFVEAGAAGLPCVAGRAGGAVEAVEDGVTGLLVDPETPRAVADGIVRLLDDPALARRYGAAGRERVARLFSHPRFRDRLGALAESLIA